MLTWQFKWQSYMALNKYFILIINHVNIFHPSLNSGDNFDQYQNIRNQIDKFERLGTILKNNVKVRDQLRS